MKEINNESEEKFKINDNDSNEDIKISNEDIKISNADDDDILKLNDDDLDLDF
jgi:hypothetical protein